MRNKRAAFLSGVIVSAVLLSGAWSQPAAKNVPEGLRSVPADAIGFVYFRCGSFLQGELGKALWQDLSKDTQMDEALKSLEHQFGVALSELESIAIVFLEPPSDSRRLPGPGAPEVKLEKRKGPEAPPADKRKLWPAAQDAAAEAEADELDRLWSSTVYVLTTTKPLDRKKLLKRFVSDPQTAGSAERLQLLFLSERSFALGEPWSLAVLADPSLLSKRRVNGGVNVTAHELLGLTEANPILAASFWVPPALKQHLLAKMKDSSRPEATFFPLVNLVWGGMTVDLDKAAAVQIRLLGNNKRSAGLAAEAVRAGLSLLDLAADDLEQAKKDTRPWLAAFRKALADVKVEQQASTVIMRLQADLEPKLIASAGREITTLLRQGNARRVSQNNLKQIGLAMHNYHDTYKGFPPAALRNQAGKPLLSWRVAILPFIEENELYQQFKFDEPWDSPDNLKLIKFMPRVFADPTGKTKDVGRTYYQVFVGPGTAFEHLNRGAFANVRFSDITDGSSNTLMVVEAGRPVIWTKPDDIVFDPKMDVPRPGGLFPDGFNAAMCDGSVRFFRHTVPQATLRLLIQRNDGQPIPPY
jgi:hypothetical protein